jgi:hypothetical protein
LEVESPHLDLAPVRFLLVEPDPTAARNVQDVFRALKISNALVVLPGAEAASAYLRAREAGPEMTPDVVLLGLGLSALERASVLQRAARDDGQSTLVISLAHEQVQHAPNTWPFSTSAEGGTGLAYLERLLGPLEVVVVTTASTSSLFAGQTSDDTALSIGAR